MYLKLADFAFQTLESCMQNVPFFWLEVGARIITVYKMVYKMVYFGIIDSFTKITIQEHSLNWALLLWCFYLCLIIHRSIISKKPKQMLRIIKDETSCRQINKNNYFECICIFPSYLVCCLCFACDEIYFGSFECTIKLPHNMCPTLTVL